MAFRIFSATAILLSGFNIICTAQSALRTGTWVQVSVAESGVYKIMYEDLVSWGFSDITSVSIFGNGAQELPLMNTSAIPDTLHEITIFIDKGSDNVFNSGDYILFYGQSPDGWNFSPKTNTFSHKKHSYCDKNFYFITCNNKTAKNIAYAETPASTPTQTVTSYDDLYFYEKNETNYIQSGRNFMETISSAKTVSFSVPNIIKSEQASLTIAAAGRHSSSASIKVSANGQALGSLTFSPATDVKPYAYLKKQTFSFLPASSNISATISVPFSGASSRGILDFCELHCRSTLQAATNEQLIFRDTKSVKENSVSRFSIANAQGYSIWNISDPENPKIVKTTAGNGNLTFISNTSELQEFVAFSTKFKSVTFEKRIQNQDILNATNADMIIVASDVLLPYAQQLANLHQKLDGFTTAIVSQEAICNEFSAGRKDVAAIRNYFRYIYIKGDKKLKYVLLFGDGTYKNKEIEMDQFQLLTFQTEESLNSDRSYCCDDFFGLLDDKEGMNGDTFVGETDVAIGRIPVNSTEEAETVTDKIIQYATNPEYRGDWQNHLCFLADDADENQTMHMTDADLICNTINQNFPQFNIQKMYADMYKQVNSSAGQRYPEVIDAISDRLQKGCLVFNYTGHANENRMMAEYSVHEGTLKQWNNTKKLPFFYAAACNVIHFDKDWTSIGEQILLHPNGGGIGIISATRYSYASQNYILCDNFYKNIFALDSNQNIRTVGEALKLAKASTSNDIYQNKRLYTLLGDPALRLAIPYYSIEIDSVNGAKTSETADTAKALSTLRVSGHISDIESKPATNYNGTLYIKLYDKEQSITTLGNDRNDKVTFNAYTNVLFQGLADIKDGRFSFSAKIPNDIFYYEGKGRLSLYANNDEQQAAGAYTNLIINGSESSEDDDFAGPEVRLFLNDTTFTNGTITSQNPTLHVFVKDSSGINVSNASIGHNITLTIDGDESDPIILNDFYYNDINTFVTGQIRYQLQDLEDGEHTLTLHIWDSFNNETQETIAFVVCNNQSIALAGLCNFPNPMKDITYFRFNHNQAGNTIRVVVRIYDTNGSLVRILERTGDTDSFTDTQISWDGTSAGGTAMKSGIYPYTVEIQNDRGQKLFGEQKILLVR